MTGRRVLVGREATEGAAEPPRPLATLRFQYGPAGLGVSRSGHIRAGERLAITYDPARLAGLAASRRGRPGSREVLGHVRFHPGGRICSGPVTPYLNDDPVWSGHADRWPPFEVVVPAEAAQVELWFQCPDGAGAGADAWDSRYGQNYWFDVDRTGLAVPERSVGPRSGAIVDSGLVRVAWDAASKESASPGTHGSRACTRLTVEARVGDAAAATHAWADLHLFDAMDELVHAATVALERRAELDEGAARFGWNAVVYQGTGGGSGMGVVLRPDVHMAQYRLYAEVHGQVFTDGVLHELAVSPDRDVLPGHAAPDLRRPAGPIRRRVGGPPDRKLRD